eukprot:Skav216057  [mRNA]  locus=scaffold2261:53986:58895:- [translate_table: standard]
MVAATSAIPEMLEEMSRELSAEMWQPLSPGAVHSDLSGTGVPRWPANSRQILQRSRSAFTSKASLFLSQQIPGKKEDLLKFKGSQSLPSIEFSQHPYPPSPAFIRDFMRRLGDEPHDP